MNTLEFSILLREWRQRHRSDAEAAAALGTSLGAYCHWLRGVCLPNYFAMCAVVRMVREGHDPLTDVRMTPAEFAGMLKDWRAEHGFSQRQAAVAIGTTRHVERSWESRKVIPRHPALAEILRRLRMPVDEELVRQATKRPRPIEPEKFAELMRAWRKRCGLTREQAAFALRSTGMGTTARTIRMWENAREYPRRPMAVLERIHGPLAVNPSKPKAPKPLIAPREFAKRLRDWRRTHCLTQMQACVALGLPRDQAIISNWESCKAFPRKARLQHLVAALQQPPASGSGTHNWYKARSDDFGQQLRAWRKACGLRQMDACVVLGLPPDQGLICRYERGEASPRRERMTRMLAIIAGTEVQP